MKFIAFYLPQYHPIPENDIWWGKGFTEWTNVAKSKPLFRGHYQPHIPADLGFYDLRLPEARIAQALLAREYGIDAFCYYHYWFNGYMLLERPFNEVLQSGQPDFPFCLCWANENWTRRWDGKDQEILVKQDYEKYDPLQHIKWLERAFRDPRYIKIKGQPLFIIYKASSVIDKFNEIIEVWNNYMINNGWSGLYICAMSEGEQNDIRFIKGGINAIIDFQPRYHMIQKSDMGILKSVSSLIFHRELKIKICSIYPKIKYLKIVNYKRFVDRVLKESEKPYKVLPCVIPSWDNSPRRLYNATIIQNDDAELYGQWLENSVKKVLRLDHEEQIVFINAWNEWGEGCHLEPDLRNGRKFLVKTKEISDKFK